MRDQVEMVAAIRNFPEEGEGFSSEESALSEIGGLLGAHVCGCVAQHSYLKFSERLT